MKNKNKINNNILKILMLTIILIASITITEGIHSFAEEVNINDYVDANYKLIASYQAKYTISNTDEIKSELESGNAYDVLTKYKAVYCLTHHHALYNNDFTSDGDVAYNPSVGIPQDLRGVLHYITNMVPYALSFDNEEMYSKDWENPSEAGNYVQWAIWGKTGYLWNKEQYQSAEEEFDIKTYEANKAKGYYTYNNDYDSYDNNIGHNKLYKAGKAVDKLEEEIKKYEINNNPIEPTVTTIKENDDTGCGTVEEGEYYKIGPFSMSDYAYVASPYVVEYSGSELKTQKDLVGGITSGTIKLNNGKTLTIGNDAIIEYRSGKEGDRRTEDCR